MDPAQPQQQYTQQPPQEQQYISLSPDTPPYQSPYGQQQPNPGYAYPNVVGQQPYPAPQIPPPLPPAPKKKHFLFIAIIGIVVLLIVAGAVAYFMKRGTSQPVPEVEASPTPVAEIPTPSTEPSVIFVEQPLQHMLIGYVEQASTEKGKTDQLTIFDPEEQESVATFSSSASGSATLKLLPWSPDGARLPILLYEEASGGVSLVWYDAGTNMFSDATPIDARYDPRALFQNVPEVLPWWKDTKSLAIYIGESKDPGNMSILNIGTDNTVTLQDEPLMQTSRSSRIMVEHPYVLDEREVGTTISIQTKESEISHIAPPGSTSHVIGQVSDSLILLNEKVASDSSEYTLDFIDPVSGTVKNTIPLSMEGWKMLGGQLLFDQQHVVIHQVSTITSPSVERFLKFNIINRRPKLIFSRELVSTGGYERALLQTGQSFITTADGQWIVVFGAERPTHETLSVQMHHIDRKETANLCAACSDISIFNPYIIYGRSVWTKK